RTPEELLPFGFGSFHAFQVLYRFLPASLRWPIETPTFTHWFNKSSSNCSASATSYWDIGRSKALNKSSSYPTYACQLYKKGSFRFMYILALNIFMTSII